MNRICLSAAALLVATSSFANPADIDAYIKNELKRQNIPGMVIYVRKAGKTIVKKAYGLANVDKSEPTQVTDRFDVGSIVKTFTGAMAMQLVEKGKLTLEAPAKQYLPMLPDAWKDVTVRQLISHSSGIPEYVGVPGIGLNDSYTIKQWDENMFGLPLDFEPGTIFQYSNSNFVLLGRIIESLTGKKYLEALNEWIAKPSGASFEFRTQLRGVNPRATGYFYVDGKWQDAGIGGYAPIQSDGMAFCTVDDMAKFSDAYFAGKIVSKPTIALATAPNRTKNGRKTGYGYAWFTRKIEGHPFISHGGNSVGYSASMSYFPDEKLSIIVMCNLYPVGGDEVALGIARILAPELKPKLLANGNDEKPDRTEYLLKGLQDLVKGNAQSDRFHADMQARLKTMRGQMAMGAYRNMADVKSLTYIDERQDEQDTIVRYRMTTNNVPFVIEFTVEPSGKIFSIARMPDPGQPSSASIK